jgi:peptidoglycan/xylan/chitin deacetylase (PgdA/CDA1 family)
VSYADYEARLRTGETGEDCVSLSFDDGFLGVHDHALPILAARDLTAVAFINPPFVGNPDGALFHFLELEIAFRLTDLPALTVSFHDTPFDLGSDSGRVKAMRRVKKLLKTRPEAQRVAGHREVLAVLGVSQREILNYARQHSKFRIMDEAQLRALHSAGWTIGSHAMTHRTLSMLDPDDLASEIDGAQRYFEIRFGWRDLPFAYPYGDVIHVEAEAPHAVAARGHPVAYTTVPGPSDFERAPHLLPRIDDKRFMADLEGA